LTGSSRARDVALYYDDPSIDEPHTKSRPKENCAFEHTSVNVPYVASVLSPDSCTYIRRPQKYPKRFSLSGGKQIYNVVTNAAGVSAVSVYPQGAVADGAGETRCFVR